VIIFMVRLFVCVFIHSIFGCSSVTPYDGRTDWEKRDANPSLTAEQRESQRKAYIERAAKMEEIRQARMKAIRIGAPLNEFESAFGGDAAVTGETQTTKTIRCYRNGEWTAPL
jgi:hypothetical protein